MFANLEVNHIDLCYAIFGWYVGQFPLYKLLYTGNSNGLIGTQLHTAQLDTLLNSNLALIFTCTKNEASYSKSYIGFSQYKKLAFTGLYSHKYYQFRSYCTYIIELQDIQLSEG